MTKTLNQIIFFSNIGNQNIFFEKTITAPPPFKLNGRSLSGIDFASVITPFHLDFEAPLRLSFVGPLGLLLPDIFLYSHSFDIQLLMKVVPETCT